MSLTIVEKVKRMREIRANCGVYAFVPFSVATDFGRYCGEYDSSRRIWRLSPSELDLTIAEYEQIIAEHVATLLEPE